MERRTYSGTGFARAFLAFQGIAILAWWVLMWRLPEWRTWFVPRGAGESDLLAFAVPDLLLAAPASLVAAVLLARRRAWGVVLAWTAAGAMAYAALYCAAWSFLRGGGWLSVVAMVPAAGCCGIAAIDASAGVLPIFRLAHEAPPRRNLAKTFLQIIAFWGFFLFVVPWAVLVVQRGLGIPAFSFPAQRALGAATFIACSGLGLWSGRTMARLGAGTPLPFDAPRRLVVAGPYRFLRNPMVVAGLGQGLGVALWSGSPLVIAYLVVGGLVWELLVRPAEEADLEARFGAAYVAYRRRVACWIPRRRAKV